LFHGKWKKLQQGFETAEIAIMTKNRPMAINGKNRWILGQE
jgi:hypothetical protein